MSLLSYFGFSEEASSVEKLPGIEFDWENPDDKNDVEAVEDRKSKVRSQLQQQYPYLNEKQIELIAVVDDAMDQSIPQVKLPRIRIRNLEHKASWKPFLSALVTPTITFVTTVAVTLALIYSNLIRLIYPYIITLVAFLASVPAMRTRFLKYYDVVKMGLEKAQSKVDPALNRLEQRATQSVVVARTQLNNVLVNLKGRVKQLATAQEALQAMNVPQTNQILNLSDLDGRLDHYEGKLSKSIAEARSSLNVDTYTPWVLKSKLNFHIGLMVPLFVLLLGMQLFGTWLWGDKIDPLPEDGSQWKPIIIASQSFAIAVAQVAFSFFLTRATRLVNFLNRQIGGLSRRVNRVLRTKAGDVFHSVLDETMLYIKHRILQVVLTLHQVQGVAHHVQEAVQKVEEWTDQATQEVACCQELQPWVQSFKNVLHAISEAVDTWTAGFLDCTGFGDGEGSKPVTKSKRQESSRSNRNETSS